MLTIFVLGLGLSFAAQDAPIQHVRSSEPRILALLNAGLARSATFRRLIDTLDASDVIVYVELQASRESRQVQRESLDAYLLHQVVSRGGQRYLRIGLGARGSERRIIGILAHELQHAVEIARAPDVRDAGSLQKFFSRVSLAFGCAGTCYETQEAKDVQRLVDDELAVVVPNTQANSKPLRMATFPAIVN
jgi:hypothetical protein